MQMGQRTCKMAPTRTMSEPTLAPRRHKRRRVGYDIQDVDGFLSKATMERPANIPVVLAVPCVLYQTSTTEGQRELTLPLGTVVNAVLQNQAWLYVQTPHGDEGYVLRRCCLPLGILPPRTAPLPPWETNADVFPRPGRRSEDSMSERSVDRLYLRASAGVRRQTLLAVTKDYRGRTLAVSKGDVVALLSAHLRDWFWVQTRDGREGFIPAEVAGHGFL